MKRPNLRESHLLLGALVVLASIAGYFGRVSWLLDLCSQFRLVYVYVFLALCAATAWRRQWLHFAIFFGFLVTNSLTAFGDLFPRADASPAGTALLRVLQMNIWVQNHDYARLCQYMRDMHADVIGIEEYSSEADQAFSRLGIFDQYPYHLSLPTSDHNSKMALLSRLPLFNIRPVFSSIQKDCTLCADISAGEHRATIVLMHPRPPVRPTLYDRSCLQLKTAAGMRRSMQDDVIVLGDLNTTQFSWKFDDFTRNMGVRDTRLGYGPAPSWPVWVPILPIDFILVSPQIKVEHFALGSQTGSDHAPVVADLRL